MGDPKIRRIRLLYSNPNLDWEKIPAKPSNRIGL